PRMPINTTAHIGLPWSFVLQPPMSAETPSTSAYAPQNSTSVTSVTPGQAQARSPNTMAAMPRRSTSHQLRPSVCSSCTSMASSVYVTRRRCARRTIIDPPTTLRNHAASGGGRLAQVDGRRVEDATMYRRSARSQPSPTHSMPSLVNRSLSLARTLARQARRWLKYRRLRFHLVPAHEIEARGEGFQSLGNDPQFRLEARVRRLPFGWCRLRYRAHSSAAHLQPKLYVDRGDGFAESQSFKL